MRLPNRNGLRGRLLLAQATVVVAMAATMVLAAAIVGPPLFHEHLGMAGQDEPAMAAQHAEEAFRSAGLVSLGVGLGIAVLGALIVSVLVTRPLARSVADLTEAAERVSRGEGDVRVEATGSSRELETLAGAFNEMSGRLAATESTRRRLLTDLAHEMRTPIAALDVCLEGLQDGVIEPDAATLRTLREQTARLTRLSADLRDVSAAEEGRLDLHLEMVPVVEVAEGAYLAAREGFARAGVTLTFDPPSGAQGSVRPDRSVRVDPHRLQQVLANLLSNALRHSPSASTVTLSVAEGRDEVLIRVADRGDGIAAEHLPHVFERFYRGDAARDRAHGGTGVGLAISRAIALAHGGSLTAESDGPGTGSTFTLALPRT